MVRRVDSFGSSEMPIVAKYHYSIVFVELLGNLLWEVSKIEPELPNGGENLIVTGRDAIEFGVVSAKPPHKPGGSRALLFLSLCRPLRDAQNL